MKDSILILGPINQEGGVTTFIEELVALYAVSDTDIRILTLTPLSKASEILLNQRSHTLRIICVQENLREALRLCIKAEFSLVVSNLYYSMFLPFIRSASKQHILHGFGKIESGLLRFLIAVLSNSLGYVFSDRTIANSYLTSSINRVFGVQHSHVVAWGVPHFFRKTKCNDFKVRDIDLIYVGRLTKAKKLDLLIEAFLEFNKAEDAKYSLHIVGNETKFSKALKEKINEVERSGIFFHGFKRKDELVRLYSRSKLFISLNPDEPFGFTYLEALACGTPVLIPQGSGISPFLESDSSIKLDMTEESICHSIRTGLHKSWDHGLVAHSTKERFSWVNLKSKLEALPENTG